MQKTRFTIDECYLMMFAEYDDILAVDEVANMLRLPVKRVFRMLRAGELKSMKYDRAVRIPKLWVIEYIQQYGFQRLTSFHEQRRAAVTVYCQEPRSRKQIQEFLDLSDKKFFMDTVMHPLLQEGVIAMTIPENPKHIKQRYVATKKLSQD